MGTVIKVENISKQYRLGAVGTNTLKGDLQRFWSNLCGTDDPTLKIGHENKLAEKRNSKNKKNMQYDEYVWALRDINFEIKQGEVLGIIGKNGAGKSTLLKILSRVTAPTIGNIKVKGRIASLLEVGTGFHPELTGRENVFLNGAILGMTKHEIRSKFDEIVDFSGISKYIDTPVKRYSSGMYVRLAFGVAAYLDPEILIVDEVLAVGDAEFQKKALGKMQDVSQGQGRTVLFVSHNMSAVQKLCTRGLIIQNGQIDFDGNIESAVDKYISIDTKVKGEVQNERLSERSNKNKKLIITSLRIIDEQKNIVNEFERQQKASINVSFEILQQGIGYNISIEIWNSRSECVLSTKYWDKNYEQINQKIWEVGTFSFIIPIPSGVLKEGDYFIAAAAAIPIKEVLDIFPDEIGFRVKDLSSPIFKSGEGRNGNILLNLDWNLK